MVHASKEVTQLLAIIAVKDKQIEAAVDAKDKEIEAAVKEAVDAKDKEIEAAVEKAVAAKEREIEAAVDAKERDIRYEIFLHERAFIRNMCGRCAHTMLYW